MRSLSEEGAPHHAQADKGVCWWSGCCALGSRARIIGSAWHWGRIWGIGAGNDALGQVINLPQCGLTCPNRANLPQCSFTWPRRLPHSYRRGWPVRGHLPRCLEQGGVSAHLRGWLVGVTGVAADGRAVGASAGVVGAWASASLSRARRCVGASAGVVGAWASAPMTVTDRFRIPALSWAHPIWRVWIYQRDVLPVDATGWPDSPRVRMGADSRRPCGPGLGAVPLEGPRERASRAHGDG